MDETHIAPSTHVRFSLKSLLLLFAVAGLAMATFGAYGVAIPFLFLSKDGVIILYLRGSEIEDSRRVRWLIPGH